MGRGFTTQEVEPGNDHVALLSYGFWQSRFGGATDIIGHGINLDGKPYTVVGVMPKNFYFIRDANISVMTPLALESKDLAEGQRSVRNLNMLGRLKSGVTLNEAQAEMDTIASRLAGEYPNSDKGWGLKLDSLQSSYFTVTTARVTIAIVGATLPLLLIACMNAAILLLLRATTRRKEIAVRAALGASRKQLFLQFLVESMLLGLAGGLAGVFVSWAGVRLLAIGCARYYSIPGTQRISLNGTALGFCLIVSVVSALIFGIVPSFRSSKINLNESLKEGTATVTAGTDGRRIRSVLVVTQIALAMVLLMGAGLLIRTFVNLLDANLGFTPKNVLTFGIDLPALRYTTGAQQADFYKEVLDRFQHLPGVEGAAGYVSGDQLLFRLEGQPPELSAQKDGAYTYSISPGFVAVMKATLIAGREFTQKDSANAVPVAVINETFARLYFPNVSPIGRHLIPVAEVYGDTPALGRPREIVGVVKDMKLRGAGDVNPLIYMPYMQYPAYPWMEFCVRTAIPPMSMVSAVQEAAMSVDREQPVLQFKTLEDLISEKYEVRFPMVIVGIFAGISLFLAAVGIFGVLSFSVGRRTHEIGIRIALGAQREDVLRMVVGQGMLLAAVGTVAGIAGALALTRFLSSLLYGIKPADLATFTAVAGLVAMVALAACYIPARRAARVDPMTALRHE